MGQYPQAIDYQQQSLVIQREIGDRHGEATSLFKLSVIYQQRGQFKRSRSYRHEAYRIWQELQLPLEALPLTELMKRMCRMMGEDWIEQMIESDQKLAWFQDILGLISLFVRSLFSPIRWLQRQLKGRK